MADYKVLLYDQASETPRFGGLELIGEWQARTESWIWVDILGAQDETEYRLLSETFRVPRLAIQDAHRDRHPPKLEVFQALVFIILRDLVTDETSRDPKVSQLAMFCGANFLVTRHLHGVPAVEQTFAAVQAQPEKLEAGLAHIVYAVSRGVVDHYTPVVLELEERLAELEDLIFERPGDDVIELITRYNRSLKRLRRHLVYQRDVMAQLSRPSADMPLELNRHEANDVFEHLERLASLCQLNQELAADLLNSHLSIVSHRLNQVMRILTITTVIFLPLALLAGIYGMNFQFMPELSWHYGYFGVLGVMAVIVIVLVGVFRRRDWL